MNCFSSNSNGPNMKKLRRLFIGPTQTLTAKEKGWYSDSVRCYDSGISNTTVLSPIIPRPNSGAQPFCAWQVLLDMNRKWKFLKRRKITLVQLGPMPDFILQFRDSQNRDFFQLLGAFLKAFFPGMVVHLLDAKTNFFEENSIKSRKHSLTNELQYLVPDIHKSLATILPKDSSCILGISWTDLYPSEELNFVLGEASFKENTAVFCFGRFEPRVYMDGGQCSDITSLDGDLMYRLIRTISHETCHLLGIQHCVYFHCAMNESSSLSTALSQPLLCCPFCTRKVQFALRFSLSDYYQVLYCICTQLQHEFPSKYMPKTLDWLRVIMEYFNVVNVSMTLFNN